MRQLRRHTSLSRALIHRLAKVVPNTYTEGARLAETGGCITQRGLRALERDVVLVCEVLDVGVQVHVASKHPVPERAEIENCVGFGRISGRQEALTGLYVAGVENVRKVGLTAVV